MLRGLPLAVAAVLLTVAFASCSGGTKHETGVQQKALEAFKQLGSHLVTASGEVSQGDMAAGFQLSYEAVAPDRHRYDDRSTFQGANSEIGVIAIGSLAWELSDGSWALLPHSELIASASTFTAARIWSLVSFDDAEFKGTGDINGTRAKHYHASRAGEEISLPGLAGLLLASDQPEFKGNITRIDIDYWIDADHGWPVQAKYHATGDGTIGLTAVLEKANDDSIVVEPP